MTQAYDWIVFRNGALVGKGVSWKPTPANIGYCMEFSLDTSQMLLFKAFKVVSNVIGSA
jgi:hypothetical protein